MHIVNFQTGALNFLLRITSIIVIFKLFDDRDRSQHVNTKSLIRSYIYVKATDEILFIARKIQFYKRQISTRAKCPLSCKLISDVCVPCTSVSICKCIVYL